MALLTRPEVTLVIFKTNRKSESGKTIYKLANFMYIKDGTEGEYTFVEPVPKCGLNVDEAGNTPDFDIVDIQVIDGEDRAFPINQAEDSKSFYATMQFTDF